MFELMEEMGVEHMSFTVRDVSDKVGAIVIAAEGETAVLLQEFLDSLDDE